MLFANTGGALISQWDKRWDKPVFVISGAAQVTGVTADLSNATWKPVPNVVIGLVWA